MNSRKKRSQTQQAEERLHESLFLNRDTEGKQGRHQATKSLFSVEEAIDQSINPHDFVRNYKNLLKDDDRKIKSLTQQVESKGFQKERQSPIKMNPLEKLELTEIDDMILLIDNCVEEANDYIGYLSQKINSLKSENEMMKE